MSVGHVVLQPLALRVHSFSLIEIVMARNISYLTSDYLNSVRTGEIMAKFCLHALCNFFFPILPEKNAH